MSKARELLLSSSRPLFEIAQECGFEDPLYFSRIFRRETGISPGGYRRGFTGTVPVYDSNINSEMANQLDLSRKKMRKFAPR